MKYLPPILFSVGAILALAKLVYDVDNPLLTAAAMGLLMIVAAGTHNDATGGRS